MLNCHALNLNHQQQNFKTKFGTLKALKHFQCLIQSIKRFIPNFYSGQDDIALHKPAWLSWIGSNSDKIASNAVDGDPESYAQTKWQAWPYLGIDLQGYYTVQRFRIKALQNNG